MPIKKRLGTKDYKDNERRKRREGGREEKVDEEDIT